MNSPLLQRLDTPLRWWLLGASLALVHPACDSVTPGAVTTALDGSAPPQPAALRSLSFDKDWIHADDLDPQTLTIALTPDTPWRRLEVMINHPRHTRNGRARDGLFSVDRRGACEVAAGGPLRLLSERCQVGRAPEGGDVVTLSFVASERFGGAADNTAAIKITTDDDLEPRWTLATPPGEGFDVVPRDMLCLPGRALCVEGDAHRCDEEGQNTRRAQACDPALGCAQGQCLICNPDEVSCSGDSLSLCGRLGLTEAVASCGASRARCDAEQGLCVPRVCDATTSLEPSPTLPPVPDSAPRPMPVFILAGQSNMVGVGDSDQLPDPCGEPQVQIWFWGVRGGGWAPVRPGERIFGPEVGVGWALRQAAPETPQALFKHATGGTSLATHWRPTTPQQSCPEAPCQWNPMISAAERAMERLRDAGYEPQVAGVFWMQGESDARDATQAAAYAENLRRWLDEARRWLDAPSLPVVIGRISKHLPAQRHPHTSTVRAAQRAVAEADPHTAWIDTDDLPLKADLIHFNAQGQVTLGERFVAAWLGLNH